MKRRITITVLLSALLIISPIASYGADIIADATTIKEKYRQNEEIEIMASILNNDTRPLTLVRFNVTIVYAKKMGGEVRLAKMIIRDLEKYQLQYRESYTVHVTISLSDLPPDKYNLTAMFICYYEPLHERKLVVLKDQQFQLLPSIEIPPTVIFVAVIMVAIIVIYIGYGISGRVGKILRRRK